MSTDMLRVALKELVDLKNLKDELRSLPIGSPRVAEWKDYERRQPLAWAAARDALGSQPERPPVVPTATELDALMNEVRRWGGKWTNVEILAKFPAVLATSSPEPPTVPIQTAWLWAGGNPGLIATEQDLRDALQSMAEAIDEIPDKGTADVCDASAADPISRDAARYRLIRNHLDEDGDVDSSFHVHVDAPIYGNRWALYGEALDAAVDEMLGLTPAPPTASG